MSPLSATFGFLPPSVINLPTKSALMTCVSCFHRQTDLYSGALFIQVCLGWNLYLSTVLMLVVTALYTIAGEQATIQQSKRWLSLVGCSHGSAHGFKVYHVMKTVSKPKLFSVITFLLNELHLRERRNPSGYAQRKLFYGSFYYFNMTYKITKCFHIKLIVLSGEKKVCF